MCVAESTVYHRLRLTDFSRSFFMTGLVTLRVFTRNLLRASCILSYLFYKNLLKFQTIKFSPLYIHTALLLTPLKLCALMSGGPINRFIEKLFHSRLRVFGRHLLRRNRPRNILFFAFLYST